MPLLLTNADVQATLTMNDCLAALEGVFADHARGLAANRPRTHTYTPLGPDTYYMFKSMDGSWPRERVHALRLSSDRVTETVHEGNFKRHKVPAAPGGRWLGLVLLFDLDTTELLAIIQDGYLQRMRVGATSGLAVKYLARGDARRAGMFGTGWQAGAQLLALRQVRPDLQDIKVYSPNRERREAFAREWTVQLGIDVTSVDSPAEVLDGTEILIAATNAMSPVVHGEHLRPGMHVNSVQGHELDREVLHRANVIVVRERERPLFFTAGDQWPNEASDAKVFTPEEAEKVATLGEVITGRAGRRADDDITLFGGGGMGGSAGLGVQFAAVASRVYRRAKDAGLGVEMPHDWFLETMKP